MSSQLNLSMNLFEKKIVKLFFIVYKVADNNNNDVMNKKKVNKNRKLKKLIFSTRINRNTEKTQFFIFIFL